ncbi:MAG: MerR family transcriptional regulator [Clostridiales Family XIII bacterium]|jgi:DNA-binding transcriptional MerR regulator|nr:MerR family transcriptional regulator [Clostridiales Family XIII bacterium]
MALYSIGQISELLGIPIRTIRYYETIDLLRPHRTDPDTNYRYYSETELFRLDFIRCLGKVLGMPLKTIRDYVKHENDPKMLKRLLELQKGEIENRIDELFQRKAFLDRKLRAVTLQEFTKAFVPHIEKAEERRIYVKPGYAGSTGEAIIQARRCSMETDNQYDYIHYLLRDICPETMQFLNYNAFLIGLNDNRGEPYQEYVLPAGTYACITYQRKDNGRLRAIELLHNHIKRNGLRPTGKLIFKGSLIDVTSIYGDDYYLTLELRVE